MNSDTSQQDIPRILQDSDFPSGIIKPRMLAASPTVAAGDMYFVNSSGIFQRLAAGSSNQVLTTSGGVPAWSATQNQSPLTTKGDVYVYSTTNTRLPVGSNTQVLTADSTQSLGVKWATPATGFWVELARNNNSGQASLSVTPIAVKKYLMILATWNPSTSMDVSLQFNNDSASNYSWRGESNGGADSTGTSTTLIKIAEAVSSINATTVGYAVDIATNEKTIETYTVTSATGAANAPNKRAYTGKWANTTDAITRIDILASTGNLGVAELVVLGSN